MNLNFLEHKLLFVTGKGGVGKTTLSFALGLVAARRGKKTLIVEINTSQIVSKHPLLEILSIDPHASFKEYVLLQIKFQGLYKAVFENKFVRYFIDATPGLADLMCIGKIYSLVKDYDLVIVDAPATGHGLALLQIPHIVSSAVKVGPLGHEAQRIDELLHDAGKTQIVLVTIPEDMPVTETIELSEKLKEQKFSVGPLFLNQSRDAILSDEEDQWVQKSSVSDEIKDLVHLERVREGLNEEYQNILKKEFPDLCSVPFIYSENFGIEEVEKLAQEVEKLHG